MTEFIYCTYLGKHMVSPGPRLYGDVLLLAFGKYYLADKLRCADYFYAIKICNEVR